VLSQTFFFNVFFLSGLEFHFEINYEGKVSESKLTR